MAAPGCLAALILTPLDAATAQYVTRVNKASSATNYSQAGVSLGAEAVDRKIVLLVVANDGVDGRTCDSLTVAGNAASKIVERDGSGGTRNASLWQVELPSGTTGDLSWSFSADVNGCAVLVYRVTGCKAAAYASGFGNSESPADTYTCTLNVPAGGVLIGGAIIDTTNAITASGGQATVDEYGSFDGSWGAASFSKAGCAAATPETTGVYGVSLSSQMAVVAASWEAA